MGKDELRAMVLDYMEKGFLENIVDMFRHDETCYPLIIDMIQDERVRVRLGATALVEDLVKQRQQPFVELIPQLGQLLKSPNPVVRGDAANLLGIIRHKDALPYLMCVTDDTNHSVREIAGEAIKEISDL